jgi:P-type Cu+ transporter
MKSHFVEHVACASCGESIRLTFAPRTRVFEGAAYYFCCAEHAEDFAPSSENAPIRELQTREEIPHVEPPRALPSIRDDSETNRGARAALESRHSLEPSEGQPEYVKIDEPELDAHAQGSSGERGKRFEFFHVPPFEFIPIGILTIGTLLSLLPIQLAEGQRGIMLPLTLLGCWGLLLLERRDLKNSSEVSIEYANEVQAALKKPAHLKGESALEWVSADKIRAGQEMVVEALGTVSADGAVVSGEATILLPRGLSRHVTPGQTVLGGSLVVGGGPLIVRAQRVGRDRALSRLVGAPPSSAIDAYFPVRTGRILGKYGAPSLGVLSAAFAATLGAPWLTAICIGAAVWSCLGSAYVHSGCFWLVLSRLTELEARGTIFPNASVLNLAGHVGTAVFCARGTVQRGKPQVAEVHSLRAMSRDEILSLVAGALASVHHPIAEAVLNTAEERDVAPHSCRSHNAGGGANMRCRNQEGHEIIVGGREFLLRERISIAWVEEKLRAIEAQAQTVLLVAEDDELVGILALADDLADGARATMQQLLEGGIEPALLSGDSRETTEALARRLHIDHVRPEAKPTDRRKEVEKLRTAGLPVAVIGRLGVDDASLLGSDLPVLLGGLRGYSPSFSTKDEGRAVAVWSGKLVDAGDALIAAHELRRDCSQFLLARLGPALLGVAATTLLVVPPVLGPLLSWAGFALARRSFVVAQSREVSRDL